MSDRSDVISGTTKIINHLGRGVESPCPSYIFYIPPREYIPLLLHGEYASHVIPAIPDRNFRVSGRRWRTRAESPLGRVWCTARGWPVHRYPGKPLSRQDRPADVPTDIQISRARGRSAIGSSGPWVTRTPCSRWKARSLLRRGRPTDGAVEAFGSARRDSCESVTLRCGGRLKRPPITFHPLRARARPRPTLLRADPSTSTSTSTASPPFRTARHFANRVNVRKRPLSR